MGWLIAKNPDNERQRAVVPIKSNLIEKPDGLAFEIVDGVVLWFDGPVNIDADALLGHVDGDRGNKDEAAEWLTDLLAVGPLATDEIKTAADAEGYSWRTLNRAKKLVGVVSEREGYAKAGRWAWSLPEYPKDATAKDANPVANTWHPMDDDNPDTTQFDAFADAHADPEESG